MIVEHEFSKYLVRKDDKVLSVLRRLDKFRGRAFVCVDDADTLIGTVSLGDINRWLLESEKPDLETCIGRMVNRDCFVIEEDRLSLSEVPEQYRVVPILNQRRRIVAIAVEDELRDHIKIGPNKKIGKNYPVFIIAEIGNNHNGCVQRAKELVKLAADSGADCVKFQLRDMQSLYGADQLSKTQNLGSEYTLDLLNKFQLNFNELIDVMRYSESLGLVPMCTPWDKNSVDLLVEFGVSAFKIASADFTNHDFLQYVAKCNKPMLCSTGMASEAEINETVAILKNVGADFVLLHCNSTYPAPFKDINLAYLPKLAALGRDIVGYSGHERDIFVSVAAVALGALVVEKHFTTDRGLEGNDHKVSLLPGEFSNMVRGIRQVSEALGKGGERTISQGEMMNRVTLAKSIFAKKEIKKGSVIQFEDLEVKSPGHGLQPNKMSDIVGSIAKRNMVQGNAFFPSDLEDEIISPTQYKFWSNWGLPVRHHDYRDLSDDCNPPILEFHLSYKDLTLDNKSFFKSKLNSILVVHAPELFENDHILDLTSLDETYRKRSIQNLQRTIEFANDLKQNFANSNSSVGIVTNIGGFSQDAPMCKVEIEDRTEILRQSLSAINTQGVEIWPQTMPPFPWHFGGQRFHNLFLDPEWIERFCIETGMRVCLDISHSFLYCNHSQLSRTKFLDTVLPHTAHLHLADAFGVDSEGLQIGEGDCDFYQIAEKMKELCASASWIPEVWQGHENGGRGFWIALERLEKAGF